VVLNVRQELGDTVILSANAFGRLLHVEQFNVNLLTQNSKLFSRTGSAGGTVQVDKPPRCSRGGTCSPPA